MFDDKSVWWIQGLWHCLLKEAVSLERKTETEVLGPRCRARLGEAPVEGRCWGQGASGVKSPTTGSIQRPRCRGSWDPPSEQTRSRWIGREWDVRTEPHIQKGGQKADLERCLGLGNLWDLCSGPSAGTQSTCPELWIQHQKKSPRHLPPPATHSCATFSSWSSGSGQKQTSP